MHPFLALLRDAAVLRLWGGQTTSAIGDELYRIAVIWLAIEAVGNAAPLLPAAQFATAVLVGLTAGLAVDRFRPGSTLIATNILRAFLVLLPVIALPFVGLSFTLLVTVAISISGLRAIFDPAMQSIVPVLVPERQQLQAMNGLLDATHRLARLIGPGIAGVLSNFVPAIHFLSITACTFLTSAAALASIRGRIDTAIPPPPASPLDSLLAGVRLLRREKTIGFVVWINAAVNGPWFIALTLGVAMLVTEYQPSFLGVEGLGVLGLVLASYGVGDVLGNLMAGVLRPRRPFRMMFAAYATMGLGYMGFAAAIALLQPAFQVPGMMLAGFIGGWGAPLFFVQMVTAIQTTFRGTEIAQVYRFRFAMMSAAMCLGALSASALFAWFGSALTVLLSGAAISALSVWGMLHLWDEPARG